MDRCLKGDCQNRAYMAIECRRIKDDKRFGLRVCIQHFFEVVELFEIINPDLLYESIEKGSFAYKRGGRND